MILPLVLLGLLLNSCAGSHGFDRDAMRALIHPHIDSAPEQAVVAPSVDTQLWPLPFRLALYFVHNDFPERQSVQKAEWLSADADLLAEWLAPLREDRILTDTFLLVDSTIRDHDVQKIRQAAARYGADAVLIVEGVGAVDRYQNSHAALYATLIGALLASGTHCDALFMVGGSMHDVPSDRRYTALTVEGHAQTVGPSLLVEDRQVLARAKKAALDEFGQRMVARLRQLKASGTDGHDRLR